jgi:hypothetical protein
MQGLMSKLTGQKVVFHIIVTPIMFCLCNLVTYSHLLCVFSSVRECRYGGRISVLYGINRVRVEI